MNTENFDIIKQSMYSTKLSRMLAQENIAVVFDSNAHTASFSPETRTLTFPHSTAFLDQDVNELFMMHEVSHALHLPLDVTNTVKEADVSFDLFNIVIDIRDERLIKQKYPGTVPAMQRGYGKLLDQGFFGVKEEINFKSFADRLNVFAKCGIKLGHFIKLNATEMDFYNRCMTANTLEECIELTRELSMWKSSKDMNDLLTYVMEKISDELDLEETEADRQRRIMEEMEKIRAERAQAIFDESFKNSILTNAHVISYTSLNPADVHVTSIKKFTDYVKEDSTKYWYTDDSFDITTAVRDMRKSIQTSVDSMVRVFESKKAAERYRNARISTTGLIDINKVHRYQFDDKIFRKAVKIPNSKNHAYYILLDFSGSMSRIYKDVIEQVVVLTEFFKRIQVPYKVVCFGASVRHEISDFTKTRCNELAKSPMPTLLRPSVGEELFEVLNHNQTSYEHNVAISGLLKMSGFGLSHTPTGTAMLMAEHDSVQFFNSCCADKKHMVMITDGEPTDLSTYSVYGKTILMTDSITKKMITTKGNASYAPINAIGKIFEHRYGIKFTSLCILNSLKEQDTSAFISAGVSEVQKADFRTTGYVKMNDPFTQNDVYFAKPFDVDTDIDNYDISEKKTTAQIAKAMLKTVKNIKKSRNFLNALAETLS